MKHTILVGILTTLAVTAVVTVNVQYDATVRASWQVKVIESIELNSTGLAMYNCATAGVMVERSLAWAASFKM